MKDVNREAIDTLFEAMEQAYKSRDLEAFVDCFDDEIVCLPPDQHPVVGKAAWREWLSRGWNRSNVLDLTVRNHVDLDGDWAIEWHTERMVTVPAAGGDRSERFYSGLSALRRQADNSWKVARYCWHRYPGPG